MCGPRRFCAEDSAVPRHQPQGGAERQHVLLLDADAVPFHRLPFILPAIQRGIFQLPRTQVSHSRTSRTMKLPL